MNKDLAMLVCVFAYPFILAGLQLAFLQVLIFLARRGIIR